MAERPINLAPDAVWPPRARPRERVVIVNPGVTITADPVPGRTQGLPLQRPHPDVRSGLVDPDVGLVPPAPDNSNARPPQPDTEEVSPVPQANATHDDNGTRRVRPVEDVKPRPPARKDHKR